MYICIHILKHKMNHNYYTCSIIVLREVVPLEPLPLKPLPLILLPITKPSSSVLFFLGLPIGFFGRIGASFSLFLQLLELCPTSKQFLQVIFLPDLATTSWPYAFLLVWLPPSLASFLLAIVGLPGMRLDFGGKSLSNSVLGQSLIPFKGLILWLYVLVNFIVENKGETNLAGSWWMKYMAATACGQGIPETCQLLQVHVLHWVSAFKPLSYFKKIPSIGSNTSKPAKNISKP